MKTQGQVSYSSRPNPELAIQKASYRLVVTPALRLSALKLTSVNKFNIYDGEGERIKPAQLCSTATDVVWHAWLKQRRGNRRLYAAPSILPVVAEQRSC
jgi:hypothetical protein